jgi:hypothetical protein
MELEPALVALFTDTFGLRSSSFDGHVSALGFEFRKAMEMDTGFFVLGAATVLRPTQFFALPFVGLAFLWQSRHQINRLPKRLIFILAFFVMGRSVGLYLPLRSALHPAMAYGDITHFSAFFHQIFALRFSKYVGTITTGNILSVFQQMVSHFWNDLTPLGAGLVIWGLGFLWWEREKYRFFCGWVWAGVWWRRFSFLPFLILLLNLTGSFWAGLLQFVPHPLTIRPSQSH